MYNNNITFVIFTYNEEHRLERVIKNFIRYGHILIADGGSSDHTLDIAKQYKCEVYKREEFGFGYVENQPLVNRLYEIVKTDWIYWAFADEMVDAVTLDKLNSIISQNKYDIINIDRKNYFFGRFCHDMFHARTNKCFKKYSIDFSQNKIHGFGEATVGENKILILSDSYYVHHFISNNAFSYINVVNRYTNEEMGDVPESIFVFMTKLFVLFLKMFVNGFIYQKGYKAKIYGLCFYYMMCLYYLVKEVKNFERKNHISTEKIEYDNNINRDGILKKIK